MQSKKIVDVPSDFVDVVCRVSHEKERVFLSCGGKTMAVLVSVEDAERLEQMEDEVDVLLARKAMEESEGIVAWEDALKEL